MRFETITSAKGAKLQIDFGGQHAQRPQEIIDVDEFIAVKSHRAKGKRLTTFEVAKLTFIEPEESDEEPELIDDEMSDVAEDLTEDIVDTEPDAMVDDDEAIDVEELMGDDIKVDPTVDYSKRPEAGDVGFSAAQLDLF